MKKDKEILAEEDSHPIERIMAGAMTKIRTMVDADTIVGSPIVTPDGTVMIPVSQVSMGFVTGGGEYSDINNNKKMESFPFAGGSGAGVSVKPIGFLVDNGNSVRMVSIDEESPYSKLLAMIPKVVESFVSHE